MNGWWQQAKEIEDRLDDVIGDYGRLPLALLTTGIQGNLPVVMIDEGLMVLANEVFTLPSSFQMLKWCNLILVIKDLSFTADVKFIIFSDL